MDLSFLSPKDSIHSETPSPPTETLSSIIPFLCRLADPRSTAYILCYIAEGAANVVFSIDDISDYDPDDVFAVVFDSDDVFAVDFVDPVHPTPYVLPSGLFHRHVLRISKGLAKTLDGQKIKGDFDKHIAPFFFHLQRGDFRTHLMDVEFVALDDEVVNVMNNRLVDSGSRQPVNIPVGSVALKMQNMSSLPGSSLSIEFKPKWLAQSPDAPDNAYRCRNCALRALRASKRTLHDTYVCPLRLFAQCDAGLVELIVHLKVLEDIERNHDGPLHPRLVGLIVRTMTDYITIGEGRALMQHLRATQRELDNGILTRPTSPDFARDAFDYRLRQAMTLRDCSWFIKVEYDADERVKVVSKLADLDFKSPDKIEDWVQKERELIDGGWYMGVEDGLGPGTKSDGCWMAQKWGRKAMRHLYAFL
jgi:inositol-pentakisphosphate 2-kinase